MESFNLITALLLSILSCISVSVSESQTVEVQRGEEVTLTCSNISRTSTLTEWFRVTNGTKLSCISSKFDSESKPSFCVGFRHGFEMSSDNSTVFLKINGVDLSDSGLYFCGFYVERHTVFADATNLIVQGYVEDEVKLEDEKEPEEIGKLMTVILGTLTVFFMMAVIVLAVKIRQLQKAADEELRAERNEDLSCEELNSAERRFLPKSIRSRKPGSEQKVETHVIYAASFRKS